ncbi:MAG: CtsR family transcriptional regulator [Selenomonadaceae bacterium]|nr:CtsR family transcriptional regulator [Selenomonadaceae bacterium]MBP3722186.1 CtsR family transcriptional regulator [Selenomonadaceae bacterium]
MANIADLIEDYILQRLAADGDKETGGGRQVELRRTDIAGEIACAPSQISYVLSTRFTKERGFVVKSRRGLGGYIKILQIPLRNLVYQDMLQKITAETKFVTVQSMVRYLLEHQMITKREAALMMQVIVSLFDSKDMADAERVRILKTMFLTLENFS